MGQRLIPESRIGLFMHQLFDQRIKTDPTLLDVGTMAIKTVSRQKRGGSIRWDIRFIRDTERAENTTPESDND
jgi:hypothetical protein